MTRIILKLDKTKSNESDKSSSLYKEKYIAKFALSRE